MNLKNLIWAFLLTAVVGCNPPAEKPKDEAKEPTTSSVEEKPKEGEAPKVALPDDLKNQAFEYYGLGTSDPIPMEILTGEGQPTRTGTQIVRLKEVKDGVGIYEISRTGSLAELGSMQVELRKDGVFVTSSSMGEIDGAHLELPNDLAPGKTWDSSLKIKRTDGSSIENAAKFRVVGTEKVTTPVGTYNDALLITSSGTATVGTTKSEMQTKGWFVKGRGAVKLEIMSSANGAKSQMTVQETK